MKFCCEFHFLKVTVNKISLADKRKVLRSSFDLVRSRSTDVEPNVGFFNQSDENFDLKIVFSNESPILDTVQLP